MGHTFSQEYEDTVAEYQDAIIDLQDVGPLPHSELLDKDVATASRRAVSVSDHYFSAQVRAKCSLRSWSYLCAVCVKGHDAMRRAFPYITYETFFVPRPRPGEHRAAIESIRDMLIEHFSRNNNHDKLTTRINTVRLQTFSDDHIEKAAKACAKAIWADTLFRF